MTDTNYSLSDIAAATGGANDGFFGGNGAWFLLILFLFAGWGNRGYGGGGVQDNYVLASDFATIQRQLSDGFGGVEKGIDTIRNGICDLGYTNQTLHNQTNMTVMQGFNATQGAIKDCCCTTQQNIKDTQYVVNNTGSEIKYAIKDCCCENEKIAMQNRFDMAQYNCNTLQAIDKLGDRIISKMDADRTQALRDENAALRLAASQAAQNNYIINQLRPAPNPAYIVPNPYCNCNNGCGC